MRDSKLLSWHWRRVAAIVAGRALPAVLLGVMCLAAPARAALIIDSVTIGGGSSVAVPPGTSVPVSVTVTNATPNLWRSTAWRIGTTPPGSTTCINTPDHFGAAETATESFNITTPATAGTYNAYIVVSNNNNCTGNKTTTTTSNGITVAAPTLAKTASSSSGVIGDVTTFRITVTNPLSVPLTGVVVSDTLPAGMSYATHAVTLGSASVSGQTVTWSIPSIPANGSTQMTLAVSLTQSGTLTNTATSAGAAEASATIVVLPNAATHFRLDEVAGSWAGAAGEVLDSGGTSLVGRRATTSSPTTTNTVSPSPTIDSQHGSVVGSFCNAGSFDGKAVVVVDSNPLLQYTTKLSASAWIYPTAYPSGGSDLYSILSNDQNYEFHINRNGKLFWWWGAYNLTSNTTIPLNRWTHVAITLDSSSTGGRQRMYINGAQDSRVGTWKGTLATNNCNFYIGGDVGTSSSCPFLSARNFRGMIDEVKLYNYELSAAEIQADMTRGRLCSGTFDHLRIEHDGNASVCAPETVTVKACLDDSCSNLYTGNVTVNLAPSGWVGGNTFTFSGGVATRQLSVGTTGDVTLGSTNVSPTPSNATRCFNGSSETCTMNFAAASCAFDAVESGANPGTNIYTKVAGNAGDAQYDFNLDVLALSSVSTINTTYTGTVNVDLVDGSSASCPTGSGLATAQSLTFQGTDRGRKTVAFKDTNAAKNVRVRMRVGSATPACSSDNFAIRPQQFALSSNLTNANLTGTPKATAGSTFTLTAATTVGSGYDGTPNIDTSKVNDHAGSAIASGTLSGSFAAGSGTSATGNAFRYLDVGNIQFATDAVVDSGFTAVDQSADCIADSTSNTLSGGKYGCHVGSAASARFGRWHPSHYSFAGTLTPACPSGNFTYMGQDGLGVALTVKAHANTSGTPLATDPVVSRYTSGSYTNVATVTFTGDNSGAAVPVSRLGSPAFPPASAQWSAGQYVIDDTFAFSRPVSPETPYDAFKLVTAVTDPDGSLLIGSSAQQATNTTRLRYGRLRIGNAYGSELLDLPIPYEAQYWTSGGYLTHRDDSCTTFDVSSLMLGSFTQNLSACETQLAPTGSRTLTAGRLALRLTRPGEGNIGSVMLTQNIGTTASGSTCIGATPSAATAANMPWFGSNPAGKAAFGVFRSPYIYYRESF